MLKSLINKLFYSGRKEDQIIKDLKAIPNFRSKKEVKEPRNERLQAHTKLKKGDTKSIYTPELGNLKGLVLTQWYFEIGDIVKSGDVVCKIENENITLEFETLYGGKIISTCRLNQKLTKGVEILKLEGI